MMDISTLVFICAVMLLIGVGLGFVLSLLRSSPGMPQATEDPDSQASSERLLTIWRSLESGSISVQINGETLTSQSDLTPATREELARRLEMLENWLNAGKLHQEGIEEISKPAGQSAPTAQPANVRSPVAKAILDSSAEKERLASLNPLAVFTRALTSEVRKPQPIQSLAAQIDAILQEMLEESPLSARGIRLQEHPQHGLIVQVGLNRYNSIDEVPEKEIRDFIRVAIAEWEKQAGAS
jgi:hypothetical protein